MAGLFLIDKTKSYRLKFLVLISEQNFEK